MELWILFGVFTALMLIGTPIAFCLGLSALATVLYIGLPPIVVFQQINSGMNAFAMMAIPFFIFAGDLMIRGGIAERLIAFAASLVGHLRGGLGQVNVVASTLFGGISGSAVADASAIGGLMIPQMEKRGYDRDYAVNVTVNSAIIALMIPPSHNMIIYSIAAGGNVSVADLFTAGIIPGILLAAALMVTAWWVARWRGYPPGTFPALAPSPGRSSSPSPACSSSASSSAASAPASSPPRKAPASPSSTPCWSRPSSTGSSTGPASWKRPSARSAPRPWCCS